MSFAFEIGVDDVLVAVQQHLGVVLKHPQAEAILGDIDVGRVERAALYGDEMDQQLQYALKDIAEQVSENNLLGKGPAKALRP